MMTRPIENGEQSQHTEGWLAGSQLSGPHLLFQQLILRHQLLLPQVDPNPFWAPKSWRRR